MITRIHAHNFRCLGPTPVELPLSPLTVLVGPNGSGKSSVLSAVGLLAESAASPQVAGFATGGRFTPFRARAAAEVRRALFFRGDMQSELSLGIEVDSTEPPIAHAPVVWSGRPSRWEGAWPPARLRYRVSTRGDRWQDWTQEFLLDDKPFARWIGAYTMTAEHSASGQVSFWVWSMDGESQGAPWPDRILNGSLFDATPKERMPPSAQQALDLMRQVGEGIRFRLVELVRYVDALRGGGLMGTKTGAPPSEVGKHGEDTLRLLTIIFGRPGDEAETVGRWAEQFGMKALRVGWVGHDQLGFAYVDPPSGSLIEDVTFAGDGSQMVLPLLVELASAKPGASLLLEEPELSLHPDWVVKFAGVLKETVERGVQVVLTTQMPTLVLALGQGKLTPDQWAAWELSRDQAGVHAKRIDMTDDGRLADWPTHYANVDIQLFRGSLGVVGEGEVHRASESEHGGSVGRARDPGRHHPPGRRKRPARRR